ncbi:LADA_0F15126g1_1 [Lachancea dasiensis]|uniref:LADA_0F15126g1_1 n=1 Tax=Lachancea dasiensis TaxID=1072105 RepID=A0A1G4JNF1_9SACH|nr:LADA_0F15126g1_1 [Lachancea dasiensis]
MYRRRPGFLPRSPFQPLANTFINSRRFFGSKFRMYHSRNGLRPVRAGSILWRYFNAPGNVVFVTTNVVTLVGIASYSTLQSMSREKMMQEYLDAGRKESWDLESSAEPCLSGYSSGPMRRYEADWIELEKNRPPVSWQMQHAKMSLFHMLYSYYVCLEASHEGCYGGGEQWGSETRQLRLGLIEEGLSGSNNTKSWSPQEFYGLWRHEFQEMYITLSRSQQFHMPNWTEYPAILQIMCQNLYDNELRTMSDFVRFYNSVHPSGVQALLRAWLYDNFQLFKNSPEEDLEMFYRSLIQSCIDDKLGLARYTSIVTNADNPRRRVFFNRCGDDLASVSLETIVDVLKGNLHVVENTKSNDSIMRLVSLIKNNCIATRSSSGGREVRIILPQAGEQGIFFKGPSGISQDKTECYRLVSQNPEIIKVLGAIAKLPT